MKQSFTYYLTLLVIRLKGLKRDFSKDPIDYKKIRRNDVRRPSKKSFRVNEIGTFKISGTTITEISQKNSSKSLLIMIPGGAFISGPAKHHWDSANEIIKSTGHTIWVCDYPKAPEHKIEEISANIDLVYKAALEKYDSSDVSFVGDSVGGTLTIALVQRLIKNNLELPKQIILISPVVDATLSNPEIEVIDKIDPLLSKRGVLSAKKMCVVNGDLSNAMISPINGEFKGFPQTLIFAAERDITWPDQKLVVEKMIDADVNVKVIEGENMPHIWPLLPVMSEAKTALDKIIVELNN